jgi:pyruvate formate lyase activating enzyme
MDVVMDLLVERRQWLDGVVISGGEPTIHKNLPDFLSEVKSMGYSVKLDTNGSNPQMVKCILTNNLVDFIAMDIKTVPVEGEYSKVIGIPDDEIVTNIKESINIIKESGVNYQFRTTWLPGIHNLNTIESIQSNYLGEISLIINTFTFENGILAD